MNKITVTYTQGQSIATDLYDTSMCGRWPVAQTIGYLCRVQDELLNRYDQSKEWEDGKLILTFDDGDMSWCVDPSVPVDALVGTLEMLKARLVAANFVQAGQKRAGLVDAMGQPIRGGM